MTRHYLDHASTSPPRPAAVAAMVGWLEAAAAGVVGDWSASGVVAADPGRVHTEGQAARAAVEDARRRVASLLGTRPRQVVFTSGGTEAANAATWGAARARPGASIVLAEVEHSCVRDSSTRQAPVERVPVSSTGRIDVDALEDVLVTKARAGAPAALVHCQWANHEVGTTQPVTKVVETCRRHDVLIHVDACAAVGHVPLALDELGADLVSVSAHKFGGPPGIGALVVRRGLRLEPLLVGGDQERARRAGFENVPAIVGFGAAADALLTDDALAREELASSRLSDMLRASALAVEGIDVLGDPEHRLPHIVCLAVRDIEAEPVLLGLDQAGIAAHSGSACASESLAPSPVLRAMGVDAERSLRLSFGWSSTEDDVRAFALAFPAVVERLRALHGRV